MDDTSHNTGVNKCVSKTVIYISQFVNTVTLKSTHLYKRQIRYTLVSMTLLKENSTSLAEMKANIILIDYSIDHSIESNPLFIANSNKV